MFWHDKYYSSDKEIDIITNDDNDSFLDESGDETDITTDYGVESLSKNCDDDIDDDASLFDDEERHPLEYYLDGAANLDVERLRQERYRPNTKSRLD